MIWDDGLDIQMSKLELAALTKFPEGKGQATSIGRRSPDLSWRSND